MNTYTSAHKICKRSYKCIPINNYKLNIGRGQFRKFTMCGAGIMYLYLRHLHLVTWKIKLFGIYCFQTYLNIKNKYKSRLIMGSM